ncbi:BTAD domain-containing putative transcriptional regulator [Streptomyces sp. NPDC020490]|uniref:AfsR/SARP family transcriptional regulator n=1 Tax=Streptomyces sp. NPDC020490 TaxID=3365078 RepID=UPI0037901082
MRFNLLGPLGAIADGRPVELGGFNQRAVTGFLLLHANEVVPTSKLIHALWGYDNPATSRKMVHNAVSGLRRIIERHARPDGSVRLTTIAPGYRLSVADGHLDLWHFRRQVDLGRAELAAGHRESGVAMLRSALSLWHGPALADLVESGIAWPELKAVTGLRMSVFEDYAQELLRRGQHHDILGTLEGMAAAEPTGERLCGLLMVALYRSGRQHDALAAYQRTRTALLDNFGLDPGHELRSLELAILNQDPALTPESRPYWQHTARRPAGVGRCEHCVGYARRTRTMQHSRRHP